MLADEHVARRDRDELLDELLVAGGRVEQLRVDAPALEFDEAVAGCRWRVSTSTSGWASMKRRISARARSPAASWKPITSRGPARSHGSTASCGFLDGDQRARGAFEEGRAGLGRRDAARVALEQPHAEVGLELADRLRERRLGDVQAGGRARHLPLLHDDDEVVELAQVEHLEGSPGLAAGGSI